MSARSGRVATVGSHGETCEPTAFLRPFHSRVCGGSLSDAVAAAYVGTFRILMLICALFFGATGAATKGLTRQETALAITFSPPTILA